ncbi:MAG: hypothetical protein SVT56_01830 [Chloroflexota bacterium]|nr:hypothetical protein [Chloroflexota bacterium]
MTEPNASYSASPDGKPTISQVLSPSQIRRVESALSEIMTAGWGAVSIIIERGSVTLIEKRTTQRIDRLK